MLNPRILDHVGQLRSEPFCAYPVFICFLSPKPFRQKSNPKSNVVLVITFGFPLKLARHINGAYAWIKWGVCMDMLPSYLAQSIHDSPCFLFNCRMLTLEKKNRNHISKPLDFHQIHPTNRQTHFQWIGLRENLQENSILCRKIYGFVQISLKQIH